MKHFYYGIPGYHDEFLTWITPRKNLASFFGDFVEILPDSKKLLEKARKLGEERMRKLSELRLRTADAMALNKK